MADNDTIQEPPEVDNQDQKLPDNGPGPQQPTLKDEDKQRLVKIITKMQSAGESDDNIKAVVKRFQEINGAPTNSLPSVDKSVKSTSQTLDQPIQFNGTFQPDLEGEKKGLYLNDTQYQQQKNDFVDRVLTDPKGRLLYPEQDPATGKWQNYYTKEPLPNFDPQEMQGRILQVPHAYLSATGGKQFISPVYDKETNSYKFPGVQTPDVPTIQTLPQATVYVKKWEEPDKTAYQGPTKLMVDESDSQRGELRDVLKEHPELDQQIKETLNKYGSQYGHSLQTGSGSMANVLQKTVEDHYDLTKPLPKTIDQEVLNGHLNILNNFDTNRQEFEARQRDLQHQADLLTDRAKRTGQPVSSEDAERLAQKASQNIKTWQEYAKSVQFSQNYVNQPEVQDYLTQFKKRQQGIQLLDEINQRAFPNEVKSQIKQDEYDRKAIEGNLNAWDYTKNKLGRAFSGLSNVGETALKILPGVLTGGAVNFDPSFIEKLNNNAQQVIAKHLPTISQEGLEEMTKHGMGHTINDLTGMVGSFAPYIVPGLAEEGLGAKAATFGTALAESMPEAQREAEKQGLTGSAYNMYVTAKPLVNAAFMTLLPNAKFAKGFDNDVAKAVVNGEFNNPRAALINLAKKVATVHPGDVAHLQAMLSGTALGNALVNGITNTLQSSQDLQRGIGRKEGLPVELSGIFNPRQTVIMAMAGKLLEAVPTLKNSIGDLQKGKNIQETYNNIENNLVELAGHNLEGVSQQVQKLLKKDPGNIYAQHLKNTLEDFAHAEARMPEGLEPEQKAALFGVQKQIEQKKRQMAYADPAYATHLQKNIDELNKQIPEILKDNKKALDYMKDAHKDFAESILSSKTESDEETKAATDPEAEGQQGQISEKPVEGAAIKGEEGGAAPSLSVEKDPNFRTLDYGDNKGKEENEEAQEKIKQEILNDDRIGSNGEKFSEFVGRVIPAMQYAMESEPHNTAIITHSSVIKALRVWEEMGRPDKIEGSKLKEFSQRYVDLKPEAEGKVHTFKGDNGNDIKVVRHGETEDNKLSEFRQDDTQLTEKGKTQAENAGSNLIKETNGEVPKIISSDLPRTLHTSDIINQKLLDHVRKQPTEEVLQREQEETGSTRGERGRVESGEQGDESSRESGQSRKSDKEESKSESKEADVSDLPFIDEEGEDEFTSTRNKVTREKVKESGLKPAMEEAARDFGTVWEQAKKKIAKGENIEGLIDNLSKKPRAVTDLENAMILWHQNVKESQIAAANKDLKEATESGDDEAWNNAQDRRVKLLDDLQKIYNVDKAIGRETARGLNARKMIADRRFSLINMQLEKSAANGGKELTTEQQSELQKQYEDIKKTKEAYEAKIEELTKQNAKLAAERQIATEKKGVSRNRKTKQEYNTERKDILKKMRADLLKAAKGGEGLTSSIPFAAQLKAIAPHIPDLVKSFIEEGIDKIEDITKHIVDLLKPDIPDIEERHVHDLISGVYNTKEEPKELTDKEKARKGKNEKIRNVKKEAQIQKYRVTDPKLLKAQADYERAKDKYLQGLKVDEKKSRSLFQKTQDTFLKYERFAKLSNPITLGKLTAAAITRLATTPIESGVGAVYSAVLPGIAKKAPGEAGINVNAAARGYREAFMKGLSDAAIVAKGGKTDIEAVFGKKGHPPPEAIDFFGQLHSAIKAPVKRFAFERSFQKRLANNIKNGVAIDGMTEARIAMEAYKDAERSIFMQDNPISKGWTTAMSQLEKSGETGKLVATIGQWLIPFVKVPTNILGETLSNVIGPEVAIGKIIATSLGKGLKNLSQDEAESIMRNLKKGTIGHVALMAGYLHPEVFGGYYQKGEKRKPGDVKPGDIKIGDVTIPAWVTEAPIFQAIKIGATVRRVKDSLVKGKAKGLGEGIWGGALGLMSHEPLIDEPSRLTGMMASAKEREYFLGELAKSTLVPAVSEYAAKVLDPVDSRPTPEKMIEPANLRQPSTIGEHIESAIPVLRENVGKKKKK